MKISSVVSILAIVAPGLVSGLEGARKQSHHRVLNGYDDDKYDDKYDDDKHDDSDSKCFSKIATVQVQDKKGHVAMKDLQVGDYVLTGTGDYSKVYSFAHYLEDVPAKFLKLQTVDQTLEMTGEHLVFLQDKTNPVRADSVKVGDMLRGEFGPAKVVKIGSVSREGLYAPLTDDGSLVVDGIVASSYVSLQDKSSEFVQVKGIKTGMSQHNYVHMGLTPFRLVCQGISTSLCDTYDETGMPAYVRFSVDLNKFADSQNALVQAFILLTVALLCGACMVLENTFGATWAPSVVLVAAVTMAAMMATGVRVRATKAKLA